jgi:hypothetical protein
MELKNIDSILGRFKEFRPYLGLSIQQNWLSPSKAVELINYVNSKGWFDRILIGSDFGSAQNPMAFSQVREELIKSGYTKDDLNELFNKNPKRFFHLNEDDIALAACPSKSLAIDLRGFDERYLIVVEEIGLATRSAGNIDRTRFVGKVGMNDVLTRWCEISNSENGALPYYEFIYPEEQGSDKELKLFSGFDKLDIDNNFRAIQFIE